MQRMIWLKPKIAGAIMRRKRSSPLTAFIGNILILHLKDTVPPVKENQTAPHRRIVAVAVALPVYEIFSYSVPQHLAALASPGMRVLVHSAAGGVRGTSTVEA